MKVYYYWAINWHDLTTLGEPERTVFYQRTIDWQNRD